MNLFVCSISFRHQLISIEELAAWTQKNHFQGIELWGIHAKNLAQQPHYNKDWLEQYGLRVSMLSDYLPLGASQGALLEASQQLAQLCKHWGAGKIRTFAGDRGSAETSQSQGRNLISSLQMICDYLADDGLNLLIETHPNTYADKLGAIVNLIEKVDRSNLKLNFDVLHIWESGADVLDALGQLAPHIHHFHLKNISAFEHLDVFAPANVYAAAGRRDGMVPLFEGAVNYRAFLQHIYAQPQRELAEVDASLEWFGHQSQSVLARDRYLIQQLQQQTVQKPCPTIGGLR